MGERESSGNLNVNNKRSLVMHRKVDGIPGIYIRKNLKASEMGGSETQPYCLEN